MVGPRKQSARSRSTRQETIIRPLRSLVTACAILLAALPAAAEEPLKIIVPYPAGGSTDILARLVGEKLTKRFGRAVIVDNRPGGDSQIGTLAVVRAPADGNTVLLQSTTIAAVNKRTYPTMQYDAQKDLLPVAMVATMPILVIANANGPRTFAEAIATWRTKPGKVNSSTASLSVGQRYLDHFSKETGTRSVLVPYKGSAPAVVAVAANEVDFGLDHYAAALPLLEAGKVRVLMVSGSRRLAQLPDVPTASEVGYPNLDRLMAFWGMFAPTGTPAAVVSKLNAQI